VLKLYLFAKFSSFRLDLDVAAFLRAQHLSGTSKSFASLKLHFAFQIKSEVSAVLSIKSVVNKGRAKEMELELLKLILGKQLYEELLEKRKRVKKTKENKNKLEL